MFSDENPFMRLIAGAAEGVRSRFEPVSPDSPLSRLEKAASAWISTSLVDAGNQRDRFVEQLFLLVYGSPLLQALVGLDAEQMAQDSAIEREARRDELARARERDLERMFDEGGNTEAILRSVAFVRLAEKSLDERSFSVLQEVYNGQPTARRLPPSKLKEILRDQHALLRLDEGRALATLPKLLPKASSERASLLQLVRSLVLASGPLSADGKRRLARIEKIFASHTKSQRQPAKPSPVAESPQ